MDPITASGGLICFVGAILIIAFVFLANAIRIVPEYQRLVVFRLGRTIGPKGPGIVLLIQTVGSMVQFNLGEPVKDNYRRFKIKSEREADDCASIFEVLSRRFTPGEKLLPPPDLIVVDGGKGQLNDALTVARDEGITNIGIIALAKGRAQKPKAAREGYPVPEQIFTPNRKNPVILPRGSAGLLLLQRIRDEAHRFALTYQKKLRTRRIFHSPLVDIPGVGKTTCARLLNHFGSIEKLREASLDEIAHVPFLKKKVAGAIYNFFRPHGHRV